MPRNISVSPLHTDNSLQISIECEAQLEHCTRRLHLSLKIKVVSFQEGKKKAWRGSLRKNSRIISGTATFVLTQSRWPLQVIGFFPSLHWEQSDRWPSYIPMATTGKKPISPSSCCVVIIRRTILFVKGTEYWLLADSWAWSCSRYSLYSCNVRCSQLCVKQ